MNFKMKRILDGELTAEKVYDKILEDRSDDPQAFRLKQFKLNHQNAASFWKKQAQISGSVKTDTPDVWNKAVEAFMGASNTILGEKNALKVVRKGEELALTTYEKMLSSDALSAFQKEEIRNTFIPRQKRHIESISAMIKMAS